MVGVPQLGKRAGAQEDWGHWHDGLYAEGHCQPHCWPLGSVQVKLPPLSLANISQGQQNRELDAGQHTVSPLHDQSLQVFAHQIA